jgi:hypothetical protein
MGSGAFSPQGSLAQGSIQGLPLPFNPFQGVIRKEPRLPQPLKDSSFRPELEAIMNGAGGTEFPRESFPLAAGAQHVKDAIQPAVGPSKGGRP